MANKKNLPKHRNPRPRIMQSATSLFAQHGATRVGVDTIAAQARVSKASLYKEFPTKDDLVSAVIIARSEETHSAILKKAEACEGGLARIIGLCQDLTHWYDSPDFTGCLVVNTAITPENAAIREIAQSHLHHYYNFIFEELTSANIHEIPQREKLAKTILTLIEGTTLLRALGSTLSIDLVTEVTKLLSLSPN